MSISEAELGAGIAGCWYVVANGSRAAAWVKRPSESGYEQVQSWDEPDARRRDADLGEDRPGRAFSAAGASQRSGMEWDGVDDSPKEHAKRDFARHLANDLAQVLASGRAWKFVLVAPPPVASAVLGHMPETERRKLAGEEHYDLTLLPRADLFARLDGFRHGT